MKTLSNAGPLRGKKTWREKLQDDKGLPKVGPIDGRIAVGRAEGTMVIPAPREVDALMRQVRRGKVTTIDDLRAALAASHGVTVACPITTGIFAWLAAHAAEEAAAAGEARTTPYWRTLKAKGEVNAKYPGGLAAITARLEAEGHTVFQKGKRAFVRNFEKALARFTMLALAPIFFASAALAEPAAGAAGNEKLAGVGMVLKTQGADLVVSAVVPNSPADGSKLIHEGDRVLGIAEGEEPSQTFRGKTLSEAVGMIRGDAGSNVRLMIASDGEDAADAREILLTRAPLNLQARLAPDDSAKPDAPDADPATPDLVFERLPGGEADKLSAYRGKIVVLEFWTTWSGPCEGAMADLQRTAAQMDKLRGKLVFITVNMDRGKEAPAARLKEKGWAATLNAWASSQALAPWQIHSLPATYVIDADGHILAGNPVIKQPMLEELIKPLL